MKKFLLLIVLITIQAKSSTNFAGSFNIVNSTLSNTIADGKVDLSTTPLPLVGGSGLNMSYSGQCNQLSGLWILNGTLNGKNTYYYSNDDWFKLSFDGTRWAIYVLTYIDQPQFTNNDAPAGNLPPSTVWSSIFSSCSNFTVTPENQQSLCSGATVASLVATGNELKWYNTETGGAALPSSTVLSSGYYYVSQTIDGVESDRALVPVKINPLSDNITNVSAYYSYTWPVDGQTYTTSGLKTGPTTNCVREKLNLTLTSPITKVNANQCGTTLAAIDANINADYIAGFQAYRFEVSNGATVNTVEVNKYNFSLTQTPGITYGTTYGVRVAIKIGGNWSAYGASCYLTTPVLASNTVLTTNVHPTFCGATLVALDTKIPASPVPAASGYRFEITTGGVTTVYDSAVYNFKLSQSGVVVDYSKTYTIRVAALVNGVYGDYGSTCSVSTPVLSTNSVPTTKIHNTFCGATLAALDTKIAACPVSGVEGYRFEITTGGITTVYDSAVYNFKLSQTAVTVAYGTTYAIRVAVKSNGIYGNYGVSCDVTTPATPIILRTKAKLFEVSAYPNPFESAFNLNLETPNKEDVTIAVYDMMGKLVETHQVSPTEVANLQIGNNFAAGIYNVMVSQANEMQAIRLIRK
jgi:hypothetical protein